MSPVSVTSDNDDDITAPHLFDFNNEDMTAVFDSGDEELEKIYEYSTLVPTNSTR